MKLEHLIILENIDINARTAMAIAKEINQNLEDLRHIADAGSRTGAGHEHNFNSLGQDVIQLGHELKKLGYVYDPAEPGMIRKAPGRMFEEGKSKKLPGQFGAQVMSPEQFVKQQGDEEVNETSTSQTPTVKTTVDLSDGNVTIPAGSTFRNVEGSNKLFVHLVDGTPNGVYRLNTEHIEPIRGERDSQLGEATKLPAQQREFGGQEFQDYMTRIKGTPDIDKKTGQVKVDKKGKEKYVSGKTKTDRYKMPYMHRSSVVKYYDEAGKRFREEDVINALKQRPKKLLKQNEKMKHSNGELEQFFNIGFAALTGVAVDESTNKLIIVNTCPGAGSCKVDCFAMKGGKVQFEAAWLSDGKILTYLLNDPEGFFSQLDTEIKKEERLGDKGGYTVTIRWHDAGDFFSPEYTDLAMKLAKSNPDVMFYAYTKMSDVALAQKPANFMINWSEGAHTSQEKPVKAQDPDLQQTKNSRIVPTDAFDDLLVKDKKGNLVKGAEGQWQVKPDQLPELKQRLAKLYNLSANSILSYNEWERKGRANPSMKWNVIIAPGEPDLTARDPGVLSTLLLRH